MQANLPNSGSHITRTVYCEVKPKHTTYSRQSSGEVPRTSDAHERTPFGAAHHRCPSSPLHNDRESEIHNGNVDKLATVPPPSTYRCYVRDNVVPTVPLFGLRGQLDGSAVISALFHTPRTVTFVVNTTRVVV
jgi:hypothetical protein